MTREISALVFDAYGTIFDVHSVTRHAESLFPGKGAALSAEDLPAPIFLLAIRRPNASAASLVDSSPHGGQRRAPAVRARPKPRR